MKRNMRFMTFLIACSVPITFLSCNNGDEKKEDNKAVTAQPMKILFVKHKVADYAKWKQVYLAHDSARMSMGISQFRLARGIDDSNMVVVMNIIQDVAKAKEFGSSDGLKAAMKNGGVLDTPYVALFQTVRGDSSMVPQMDRMMVIHRVKDFDTWLKVYDKEGTATRAENGMIDKAIARGIEDSNMVYIIFAISDIARAKARAQSPDLKKIMEDAGVEGKPEAIFYRLTR